MASSHNIVKQSTGWGGFLQQAVLSVESKLDTILAEDDQPATKTSIQNGTQEAMRKASANTSRSSSTTRTNDRLQERLARAVVRKKGDDRSDSPASTYETDSRTSISLDKNQGRTAQEKVNQPLAGSGEAIEAPSIAGGSVATANSCTSDGEQNVPKTLATAARSLEQQSETPALSQTTTPIRTSLDENSQKQAADIVVNGVQAPREGASPEEMYTYIEKIDALQAKLRYLSREAAISAHDAALAAKSGSVEKKLIKKDEKIALLMEEGEKLSKNEMKHLMLIKKLRSQATEIAKNQLLSKARAERADAALQIVEERADHAEQAMRSAEETLEVSLSADRDLEAVRSERDALTTTLAEIRAQLAHAMKRAESAEHKAQKEALSAERKQLACLKDDLSTVRVEREISEGKLRREIKELRASLEQEKAHSNSLKVELRAEQSLLESKMESLRNQAEEASSSSIGDVQAKLLRQIETLQNQYAIAKENWQGIEGSLLARMEDVEKDRNGLEQREGEFRKKAREMGLKAKAAEKENEASRDGIYRLEQTISEQASTIQRLERKARETEDLLAEGRQDLEMTQRKLQTEMSRRVEEDKSIHKEQIATPFPNISRNDSPIGSTQKSAGLKTDLQQLGSSPVIGRGQSRRSSIMPHYVRSANVPPQQNPSTSIHSTINGLGPETPASQLLEQDDYFPDSSTPASFGTNRGVNDLVSASTVGAGPSVQLVERMSASVRRLESEKIASKDELARLTSQRDESRKEVVTLMREVEQKRANEKRIEALEEELGQVDQRHQTTLEMLGEKSELVEELKADVADVKQMYRDLVDSTMK